MWTKLKQVLCRFLGSCWLLPGCAAIILATGFLMVWVTHIMQISTGESPVWLLVVGVSGLVLCLLGSGLGALVPLWLVVLTVIRFKRAEYKRMLCGWGVSALAAGVAVVVAAFGFLLMLGGGPDYFAKGLEIPEDREFVLPRKLTIFSNMPAPSRVLELKSLKPALPEPGPETGEPPAAPNLQKLSATAPELLQEYMLRALYAEATNPRFNSPVLAADASIYPAHENDPQTCALRYGLEENIIVTPSGARKKALFPVAKWKFPLQNGWYIAHTVDWFCCDEDPAEDDDTAAEIKRLDDALAPLAQQPTREQLDALLPTLPEQPFLCIWNDGAGVYDMLIIIPPHYEAGTFELRAHEITTGKRIGFRQRWRAEQKLGNVCRLLRSDGSLIVHSGDWGEYYGSVWEIWFTPASGGPARKVSRQDFIMMGWQH